MKRRAKIICTLGPASDSPAAIEQLVASGLDVARLNFSHGAHDEHARRLRTTREAAQRVGKPISILLDLAGPKTRTGVVKAGHTSIPLGATVVLVEGKEASYPEIAIDEEGFDDGLREGDRVLLDDGRITLRVTSKLGRGRVECTAELGGELRDRVGVHLPADSVTTATFTADDRADLAFGLEQGIDYVAVSFVRRADDMHQVRAFCEAAGKRVPLVAKIETPPAIEHLEAIVAASDVVMVARGDLGVEFPPEVVPVLQRRIIATAHRHQRPVIVATEMLHSMVESRRPTRAEASDVAHAVFDGADAVMLSAETAIGRHPALAVEMMSRIVVEAERSVNGPGRPGTNHRDSVAESIAFNAADIAEEIGARALVAFSLSGDTARLTSLARPRVPVVAFSPSPQNVQRMALLWGVNPLLSRTVNHSDELMDFACAALLEAGLVQKGDTFVAVFGAPVGSGSATNAIAVRVVT